MRRLLFLTSFLCACLMAKGQTYDYRYWFDQEPTAVHTGTAAGPAWHFDADLTGISEGMHTLHVQVRREDDTWSVPVSRVFIKMAGVSSLVYRIWTAGNEGKPLMTTMANGTYDVDVSALKDGLHTLYIQASNATAASTLLSRLFIKIPQTEGAGPMTCMFWVDDQLYRTEQVAIAGGTQGWVLDVSQLPDGIHRYMVQVVSPSGVASSAKEGFFLRTPLQKNVDKMKCYFIIDNKTAVAEATTVSNGVFHFDLDVAEYADGLHSMNYWLADETGMSTAIRTTFFVKTPLGGNGIMEFQYWLNDLDGQKLVTKYDPRQEQVKLIDLLPVETQAIRSQNFQFAIEDGEPLMYAKNELHIRFIDAAGRFADATREYVDEQVSQPVEDITPLESEVRQTIARPAANQVKWFSVKAQKGDSLTFRADRACTLQLFSPSGMEIYKASGSASVAFDGAYAEEDGTFYLALHDVTANSGTTVAVDYQHINKFAILDYAVDELGVLPSVQMVGVSGNGFHHAKSAELRLGNSSIAASEIVADGKADAQLLFTFKGNEAYGDYDLIVHFDDDESEESVTVNRAITLGTPDFGDIAIEITDPRSVASPYPVSIKVTNTGNLTYTDIPFYMAYDNVDRIWNMRGLNFKMEVDEQLIQNGQTYLVEVKNFKGTNNVARMIPAMIPYLAPGESRTYILGFRDVNLVTYNVYAWIGTPWNLYVSETMAAIQEMAQSGSGNGGNGGVSGGNGNGSNTGNGNVAEGNGGSGSGGAGIVLPGGHGSRGGNGGGAGTVTTSCMPDPCEYAGYLNNGLAECGCATFYNLGGVLGNIVLALQNRHHQAQRELLVMSGNFTPDEIAEYFPMYNLQHPNNFIRNWLGHCVPNLGTFISQMDILQNGVGQDPCSEPVRHECNQWYSSDPNDIFGYVHPVSGNPAIGQGVTEGYYTIEFENDPELATAAAHKIVVEDKLDGSVLDLSTFEPTGIRIGYVTTEVNKDTQYPITIDLRPSIDVIAQVDLDWNATSGMAKWTIVSLDPMTMEPTNDAMQGVLPVNHDGTSGQGELMFNIKFKEGLEHGTEIKNSASIIFDNEEAILTPTWVNTVDLIAPESKLTSYKVKNGTDVTLEWEGTDEGSGVWKYEIYMLTKSSGNWKRIAEVTDTTAYDLKLEDTSEEYGFCVVATDYAGNVENKELKNELEPEKFIQGDANGDGIVDAMDVALATSKYLGDDVMLNFTATDVVTDGVVDVQDVSAIRSIFLATQPQPVAAKRRLKINTITK